MLGSEAGLNMERSLACPSCFTSSNLKILDQAEVFWLGRRKMIVIRALFLKFAIPVPGLLL